MTTIRNTGRKVITLTRETADSRQTVCLYPGERLELGGDGLAGWTLATPQGESVLQWTSDSGPPQAQDGSGKAGA
jgi:hypothetical protein